MMIRDIVFTTVVETARNKGSIAFVDASPKRPSLTLCQIEPKDWIADILADVPVHEHVFQQGRSR